MPRLLPAALLLMVYPLPTLAAGGAADTTPLPPQVKADAEAIAASLLEVQRTDVELSCPKAVENARYGLETMLDVGAKNVAGGYMDAAKFEAMATPMRGLLPQITDADCEGATDAKRDFYQCMSSDYNHVLACAKAHLR